MKYFYFLLSILLVSVLSANAQTNYKPGYILTPQRDTVKGYVDYREWGRNPRQIFFKTSLNPDAQKITVSNANGFGINGIEFYDKAVVPVSTASVDINRLSVGIDTAYVTDTVFLKVRVNGSKLTLFELNTDERTLFYLKDKTTGTLTALNQYTFLGEDNHTIVYSNRYIGQLITFANTYYPNDKKLNDQIIRSGYNADDLKRIVLKLNGDAGATQTVVDNGGIRYFISAGVANRKLSYSGNDAPFSNGKSTTSISPMVSGGVDFLINKRTQKTVFRIEAGVSTALYKLAESRLVNAATQNILDRSFEVKQTAISIVPQVIYNFYSTAGLKIFGDFGVGANLNIFKDQKYRSVDKDGFVRDTKDYELEGFQITIPIKIGVQVGNSLQIYGGYMLPTSITRYVSWSTNLSAIMGGVTYLF